MEEVIIEIESIYQAILRTETNFKKIGKANINLTVVRGRLDLLNQRWNTAQTLDLKLQNLISPEDKVKCDYFKLAQFLKLEDAYLSALDFLNAQIHRLSQGVAENSAKSKEDVPVQVKLPQISLKGFSGNYSEWENFRDLFNALIIQNTSLTNVTRLYYLKTVFIGEAAQLVNHMPITDAGFTIAWDKLKSRYENKRALITAHIQKFMDIPIVGNDSVEGLKLLRDDTNESLAALKTLKRPVEEWQDLLVFIVSRKLDSQSLKEWEMRLGVMPDYPTFTQLDEFLLTRIRALESVQVSKSLTDKVKNSKTGFVKSHAASVTPKCLFCKENHALYKCLQFKGLSVDKRREIAQRNNCCFNCLVPGHRPQSCYSKINCAKCHRRHNTLLHSDLKNDANVTTSNTGSSKSVEAKQSIPERKDERKESFDTSVNLGGVTKSTSCSLNSQLTQFGSTLLATAQVDVESDNGRVCQFRVLLDQGSECSFVSEKVINSMKSGYKKVDARVFGVGGLSVGSAKKLAYFKFLPKERGCKAVFIPVLVLPKLTSYKPPIKPINRNDVELKNLLLADSDIFGKKEIDFILGADRLGACLLPGLKQNIFGNLTAQSTIFGWVLSGRLYDSQVPSVLAVSVNRISVEALHDDLVRFWQMEELPSATTLTEEELRCEQHFVASHQRLKTGRYMIRLPFKSGPPIDIGHSFDRARIILDRVLKRLVDKPLLLQQYKEFIQEYAALGHMRMAQVEDSSNQIVYLPHHCVVRESSSTTKLRVVFNASSMTSNHTSLNSHLHTGPILLNDLVSILLRWRENEYVYMADAEKMFRQILIHPEDLDYQRILWRDSEGDLQAYQLLTVTYGTACAPYLANRVIKQLARDDGDLFPLAKSVLEQDIYVDDCLFGADDLVTAKEKRKQVDNLMRSGGFHLRKWAANNKNLLDDCEKGNHEQALEFDSGDDQSVKVLGLNWEPKSDSFRISVTLEANEIPTKRTVLSMIAKLYDPLGWITPVIVTAKLFMQELWLRKIDWDESLPSDMLKQWFKFYNDLINLKDIIIPRWIRTKKSNLNSELHAFSDASNRAYAAGVYLRVTDESGNIHVSLLISKSKIAPINPVSIPRLELCAAVLLAKLLKFVVTNVTLSDVPCYCYTDSNVVLAWLNKHPSTWKTFVANRVAHINELIPRAKWISVPSKENAADCASRGLMPREIINYSLWWKGPSWLSNPAIRKTNNEINKIASTNLELKSVNAHHVPNPVSHHNELIERFSSWPRLLRVSAYCLRFITNCRTPELRKNHKDLCLTNIEISNTRLIFLKLVQREYFESEIKDLKKLNSISSQSSIKNLNPFLDANGILRVGGRLRNAPIGYDEKHPILLPRHVLSEMIASHGHLRSMHGGIQLTLHVLRQNYWILGARMLVKSIIKHCMICVRDKATVSQQLMGDLPDFRVTPSLPFTHTGVDYAGPFEVKLGSGRGYKSQKAYIALFVCCCVRAIHLELVSDCTSSAFLAAFHRFVSRRGKPAHMYSDNGRNFVGASNELEIHFRTLEADTDLQNRLTSEGTSWHFIPPSAPHFGEFYTLLTRIEAVLNSRPVAPLSENVGDFAYLTPSHFLTGAPLITIPEPSLEFTPENRLTKWGIIQKNSEIFWKKWSIDYLQSLQKRYKWSTRQINIEIGDMVLIRHDNLPPAQWLLGRVIECYRGSDELIRVVKVKTADSELTRPISKLCLLPVKSAKSSEVD